MIRIVLKVALALLLLALVYVSFTLRPVPAEITYGLSFSTLHASELGLPWQSVYTAMLDDLKVRDLRIPAYWPQTEPQRDVYDWINLDFQVREAEARNANIILAVGRRLPRWPECHVPLWASELSWDQQKAEIREYITDVVERYKSSPAIKYWQVENEPYLRAFAFEHCGVLDEGFLKEEIALVKSLDSRPVLVTDSGNLGTWLRPYQRGDAFGTSLYIYFWNPELGQFKTKLPALVYRAKERLMQILFGQKPSLLIELSLEPWLVEPTANASLEDQLSRMDIDKFNEIVAYAKQTSFEEQYLWGVEWWYYMRERGHPEFWDAARRLYVE